MEYNILEYDEIGIDRRKSVWGQLWAKERAYLIESRDCVGFGINSAKFNSHVTASNPAVSE